MRTSIRGIVVLAVLALGASSATANRSIEIRTPEGGGGLTSEGKLFLSTEAFLEPGSEIACDVTLLRTIGRLLGKIPGSTFGRITAVRVDRGESRASHCLAPGLPIEEITFLSERGRAGRHVETGTGILIWDVTGGRSELWALAYDGFEGVLPEIINLRFHIQGFQFQFSQSGNACLYRGEAYARFNIDRETRAFRSIEGNLERTIFNRDSGSILCQRSKTYRLLLVTPRATILLV